MINNKGGFNMKQYTVEEAYTGNDKVTLYNNGKLEFYDIMSLYETDGYCNCLKNQGYTRVYDVSKYEKEMKEAKKNYDFAIEQYNMAKENPLIKL